MGFFENSYCEDGVLGSGSDVFCRVTTQGGKHTIAEFTPMAESMCEKTLNTTSTSTIGVPLSSKDKKCCEDLGLISVNKMDLEWWGYGLNKPIWAGPITAIDWSVNSINISASDNSIWWSVRDASYYSEYKELSEIALDLHMMAMKEDPVVGFTVKKSAVSKSMKLESFSQENTKISDLMTQVLAVGIDYTVLGRSALIGDADLFVTNTGAGGYIQSQRTTPFRLMDSDMYTSPVISANGIGSGFATRVVAGGKNARKVTVTAPWATVERYGLVSTNIEFPDIDSQDALMSAAKSWLARHSNPYYINETHTSVLKPGSPIPYRALIPGLPVLVESTSTCMKFRTLMRVSKVVTRGDGKVEVSLEPMGEVLETELTGTSNSNG